MKPGLDDILIEVQDTVTRTVIIFHILSIIHAITSQGHRLFILIIEPVNANAKACNKPQKRGQLKRVGCPPLVIGFCMVRSVRMVLSLFPFPILSL